MNRKHGSYTFSGRKFKDFKDFPGPYFTNSSTSENEHENTCRAKTCT